ncbi:uroporphyrinogen decarboxylase family protein [Faecalicatena contorta]|uniref:uroporphyrinogen decarboxylase family protein n=1 Tax=Faecalicatena contorta TaxID=39482 RepID=UPI0031D700EF
MCDGIKRMLQAEKMSDGARIRRAVYEVTPDSKWIQTEFGYYSLEAWHNQGKIEGGHDPWEYDEYLKKQFFLEEEGQFYLNGANWEAAEFYPRFEDKVLEDRGDKEVIQDEYGRTVLVYKRSRTGYMPEYLGHPVRDIETWKTACEWRMDPSDKERYKALDKRIPLAIAGAKRGDMMVQRFCGGFMYLRSLMGPENLLYLVYDDPELIHVCMKKWLELADAVAAYHQQFVTLDELFFGEDITYNMGPLISPHMIREFLFPYYRKLIENVRSRQQDPDRTLYLHLDTDGKIESVIPLYQELGFQVFSPFEVASGSDVREIGKKYPNIVITGGIDKRMFSKSKEEMHAYLDQVLPVMKKRGGYIPTCDHGVPEEADFDNYVSYRRRCYEMQN